MGPTKRKAVADKLAELKGRFAAVQRAELTALTERIEALAGGRADSGALHESYRQLHRLAGSAGTLGFPALGDEARELERQLKPLVEISAPKTEAMAEVLDHRFRQRLAHLATLLETRP